MRKATFLFFIFVSLFSACRDHPILIDPSPDPRPFLATEDFDKIAVSLIDHNLVQITHALGVVLRSEDVVRVEVGTKDSVGYHTILAVPTRYDPDRQEYIIDFEFQAALDPEMSVVPLSIRYRLIDSTHVDVDTSVPSYKYPYPTAEIVVPFSALEALLQGHHLQDVDLLGSDVLFHPMSNFGVFSFSRETNEVSELLAYSGGDHIAADSIYLFLDVDHYQIVRFNVELGVPDIAIPPPGTYSNETIRGMDVHGGHLFVQRDQVGLRKYTLDGVFLDSIDYSSVQYMTLDDGLIYEVGDRCCGKLRRYDLHIAGYLEEVLAPARQTEGIKIHDGILYYCDYDKRMIGAVPVADLRQGGSP